MKIYLRDLNQELVKWWSEYFKNCPEVKVSCGNIFDIQADAIVSPGNSFGFMDGGIDAAYSKYFGNIVGGSVRAKIEEELPIGQAIHVYVGYYNNSAYDYLIAAPTMRVPQKVHNTFNAYLAFKAALNCADILALNSILSPGMCTYTGQMSPKRAAYQMYRAYEDFADCPKYKSLSEAIKANEDMLII